MSFDEFRRLDRVDAAAPAHSEGPSIRGFDIAWMSQTDGPGTRVVVFLQGCNAACTWCHSPHSQPARAPLLFFEVHCRSCGGCVTACPRSAHTFVGGVHRIDRHQCTACGRCVNACIGGDPTGVAPALRLPFWEYSVGELWRKLQPELDLIGPSGGLTISGGEPLLQATALLALLRHAHEYGTHVAVETSGHVPVSAVRSLVPFVSLWMFGLRAISARKRRRARIPPEVCANFRFLASQEPNRIVIRLPLIPGITDTPEAISDVAAEARSCAVTRVELLPLHPGWRLFRYAAGCGSDTTLPDGYSVERLADVAAQLVAEGLNVTMP